MIKHISREKLLTESEIKKIHNVSLKILQNTGVNIFHEEALEILKNRGAEVEGSRVYLPASLIESAVKKPPSSFKLYSRNPAKSVVVGSSETVISPTSGPSFVSDLDKGRRRATYEDYLRLTRLAAASEHLDILGGLILEPTDLPAETRHARLFYAGAKYSDKCLRGSCYGSKKALDCLKMAAILFGEETIIDDRVVLITIISTNSPLQFDNQMTGSLIEHAKHNQAVIITPAAMAGTTGPMSIAGTLALQNAEILAGIALTQIINPGTPVVYGSASTVTDLRTAGLTIGSPEQAKFIAASIQLADYYNLPSRTGGALTDAVIIDSQSGYESMMNLMTSVSQGANLIVHSLGIMESYMTVSFEKFIIDNEILGMLKSYNEGIEVDEESLAEEVINQVGPGGHFLEEEHTFKHMRDFYQPTISSRLRFDNNSSHVPTVERAREKWKSLLRDFEPPYLDKSIDKRLNRFIAEL